MWWWLVGQTSGSKKRKEAGDEIENINNNACEAKKKESSMPNG